MRKLILPLILGLLISCNQADNKLIYEEFIDGYYNDGFESIAELLSDSIIIADIEEYKMKYSKQEFEVYYKWDSVFKPEYSVLELGPITDSTINVTQSVTSKRFEFLDNSPLITRHRFYFTDNNITKIENVEYLNVDFDVWIARRDSLVNWINRNHEELSGFIFDMTQEGAEDYLKAIELYQTATLSANSN